MYIKGLKLKDLCLLFFVTILDYEPEKIVHACCRDVGAAKLGVTGGLGADEL